VASPAPRAALGRPQPAEGGTRGAGRPVGPEGGEAWAPLKSGFSHPRWGALRVPPRCPGKGSGLVGLLLGKEGGGGGGCCCCFPASAKSAVKRVLSSLISASVFHPVWQNTCLPKWCFA